MKRPISLILSTALVFSLFTGCGKEPEPTQVPTTEPAQTTAPVETTPTEQTIPTETTVPPETIDPALLDLQENLPIMDGSTSLIPLDAGLRAALFDISIEDATAQVSHTSSWNSFYNLLEGNADLVFSVPLSQQQWDMAAEQGITLETVPIAMEGFVFVVNAQNPVDTLTQAQIRDIYSGKITNWSQVGGLDEEIIPYQRNSDSGSQNYMIDFMGDTPLTDAPTELRPASMFGLMEVIAAMDDSRAAIGYSVYAYAADMYGNGDEIKFIQVDGVAPSKATFADGTYPLMGYNYAIFNANEPQDSHVRRFVDWILSDAGQYAVAQAGYVTVRDIGYDYQEAVLEKYQGVGTGAPAQETVAGNEYVYQNITTYTTQWGSYSTYSNEPILSQGTTGNGYTTWHLTELADKALENEINFWIDAQAEALYPYTADAKEVVATLNSGFLYGGHYSDTFGQNGPVFCSVTLVNGYLSVEVSVRYWKYGNDEHYKYYRTETAIWDLLTGRRLTTEELFCEGVDIDKVLNDYLTEYTQVPRGEFRHRPEMKQDFAALSETGWHLTSEGIYIDYGSDAFVNGEFIPLDWLPDGVLVTQIPRDFSAAILCNETTAVISRLRISDRDLAYTYYAIDENEELYDVEILKEDCHPNAARINADLLDYLSDHYQKETIFEWFAGIGYAEDTVNIQWLNWYSSLIGGRYFLARGSNPYVYNGFEDRFIYYPYDSHLLYDLETGNRLHWTDILEGNWLANSTMRLVYPDEVIEPAHYEGLTTEWFEYDQVMNQLCVCLNDGEASYYLYIPAEYIK